MLDKEFTDMSEYGVSPKKYIQIRLLTGVSLASYHPKHLPGLFNHPD